MTHLGGGLAPPCCETGNRHPVEYAWIKDGSPLASKADTVNVSLEGNEASGKFECHVTNLAGIASKSLSIDPIGKTGWICIYGLLFNYVSKNVLKNFHGVYSMHLPSNLVEFKF